MPPTTRSKNSVDASMMNAAKALVSLKYSQPTAVQTRSSSKKNESPTNRPRRSGAQYTPGVFTDME